MPPLTRATSRQLESNQKEYKLIISPSTKNAHVLTKKSKKSSTQDSNAIILLVVLYLLQGVPLGLAMGSLPFLLKSKLGFGEMAILSLSQYPYSLKLFWSPIVDSIYWKEFGRRKSWIVPLQFILGILMMYIGWIVDDLLEKEVVPIMFLAGIFTLMVFLCATQDIAVDGWAISLLTEENKTYASTAQTIGLNAGFFLSFTVFLAFNSFEFCNTFLRTPMNWPVREVGILSLGAYLFIWGVLFLMCNVCLLLFKTWDPVEEEESIISVYITIRDIIRLSHMQELLAISMICKIGWQAHEAITAFKLMELGFKKEHLALTALLDFPLQIVFGFYAAKWSSGPSPLTPWRMGYYGRLLGAFAGMLVVYFYPKDQGLTSTFFLFIIAGSVLSNFASTIQFVSMGSYFSKISDPAIGGTYMTLLNTMSNFGGTWPKYFIMLAVDYSTVAPCSKDANLKCMDEKSISLCKSLGGECNYIKDGYYQVTGFCLIFGFLSMILYIHPVLMRLQRLPDSAWRIATRDKTK